MNEEGIYLLLYAVYRHTDKPPEGKEASLTTCSGSASVILGYVIRSSPGSPLRAMLPPPASRQHDSVIPALQRQRQRREGGSRFELEGLS